MFNNSTSGQANIFYVLFTALIFILVMASGFGKMINTTLGIATANISGIEGFLLNNLVLIIMLIFILWIMIRSQ